MWITSQEAYATIVMLWVSEWMAGCAGDRILPRSKQRIKCSGTKEIKTQKGQMQTFIEAENKEQKAPCGGGLQSW